MVKSVDNKWESHLLCTVQRTLGLYCMWPSIMFYYLCRNGYLCLWVKKDAIRSFITRCKELMLCDMNSFLIMKLHTNVIFASFKWKKEKCTTNWKKQAQKCNIVCFGIDCITKWYISDKKQTNMYSFKSQCVLLTCVCPTTPQPVPCSVVPPWWRWRHSFLCLTLSDEGSPHTVEPACREGAAETVTGKIQLVFGTAQF